MDAQPGSYGSDAYGAGAHRPLVLGGPSPRRRVPGVAVILVALLLVFGFSFVARGVVTVAAQKRLAEQTRETIAENQRRDTATLERLREEDAFLDLVATAGPDARVLARDPGFSQSLVFAGRSVCHDLGSGMTYPQALRTLATDGYVPTLDQRPAEHAALLRAVVAAAATTFCPEQRAAVGG